MNARVWVLDDEPRMAEVVGMVLRRDGHEVQVWTDPRDLLRALPEAVAAGTGPDVLLTDLRMPHADGMAVLAAARTADADLPVIVFSAHGTVDAALAAVREGAWDFLEKPVDNERCRAAVRRAVAWSETARENRRLRARLAEDLPTVVAESPAMLGVLDMVARAARAQSPVLLTGESGTGKEVLARRLHHLSPRVGGPFVAVNCTAFGSGVLESELFGHERGAFTGAERSRAGVFERAHQGTLFLDEIGDIDLDFQAKLLRVVQEGEVLRVGGDRPRPVNVRIVTATLRDLPAAVAEGRFREDLWFRLAVIPIHVPPLRERPEDVLPLARHMLARAVAALGRDDLRGWSPELEGWMLRHRWPGNVRELANVLERGAVLARGAWIEPADVLGVAPPEVGRSDETLDAWLDRMTASRLTETLAEVGGVRQEAARRLGIDRTTLYRLMKRFGLSA